MISTVKRSFISVVAILMVCSCLVGYYSCVKDKCANTLCNNGGVCVNAVCACPDGYEGLNCESQWSDKFIGEWQVDDYYSNDTNHHYYKAEINGAINRDSFIIYNFTDSINVLCAKTSYLKFVFIPDQKMDTFFTLKEGFGVYDTSGKIVTGMYSFIKRTLLTDSTTKDTLITTKFTWTR